MTPRPALARLAGALVLLAACGRDEPAPAPATTAPPVTVTTTSTVANDPPGTGVPTTAAPALDEVRIVLTPLATLDEPIALAVRPGHEDLLFVAERGGRVVALSRDGADQRPVVDISEDVAAGGERGLLGLAFDPDGARLYLSYTAADGANTLVEYAMGAEPAAVDPGSRREVLRVAHPRGNHNGGNVIFGPDGLLYLGLGDGGGAGDPDGNGQNPDTLLGSILRIDPRPRDGGPYGIPADNPFAGGGGRGEVYVYGLRNPWRFSFDRASGDLWIGDVGQRTVEEIDFLPAGSAAGANLGWNRLEGTRPFQGEPPPDAVGPVFEYERESGVSVIGGFVYRGSRIPGLQGAYLFTDAYRSTIRALVLQDGTVALQRDLAEVAEGSAVSFGEDADGEIYVLSLVGPVLRIDPAR